jgi:glycerol-3-phosphate O-acyltransferase/dihydroxyacetone phosphate acyltransferase
MPLLSTLYLIVCFPLYLYGLVNNYIPYIIPSKVARLITRDEVYIAPIMMTTGIFSFTICYNLQIMLFHQVIANSGWLTLAYAVSLPVSGFFVLHYWNYFVSFYSMWNFSFLFKSRKSQIAALLRARVGIMQALDKARKEYTAYMQYNRQGSLQGKRGV